MKVSEIAEKLGGFILWRWDDCDPGFNQEEEFSTVEEVKEYLKQNPKLQTSIMNDYYYFLTSKEIEI